MNSEQRTTLKKTLNAPGALSLRYFPFFIVITFPFLLIIDNIWRLERQDQLLLTLAKAIGYGLMYIYFLLVKLAWDSRQNRTRTLPILLFLSGLGGPIQGAVSGGLLEIFGVNTPISIADRSLTAFFVALTWLPINAVATSAISTFRKTRSELLQRIDLIGRIEFEQAGLAKNIRSRIEQEIVEELKGSKEIAHSKFQRSIDIGGNATNINTQLIKEYANQNLREISHRLWNQSETKSIANPPAQVSEIRNLWELYRMSFFLPPVDSLVHAFLVLSLFLPLWLRGYSIVIQLETAITIALVSFGVLRLLGNLYKRFPNRGAVLIPLRTYGALISAYFVTLILNNEILNDLYLVPLPSLISTFIIFVFVDIAISIAKSTLYSQEEQVEALYRTIGSQKAKINLVNLEIALISREWAQHIHGTLSSKLLASAAILENTIPGQNLELKEAAIAEAIGIMNGEFARPASVERNLMQEIMHKTHQWTPIIDIDVRNDVDIDFPTIPVEKFGLVIEEAIANAYRHGQATKVTILLKPIDSNSLLCTITDNGIGMAKDSKVGLGSALFETLAPGNWSREAGVNGVGTCLNLLITTSNLPSRKANTPAQI